MLCGGSNVRGVSDVYIYILRREILRLWDHGECPKAAMISTSGSTDLGRLLKTWEERTAMDKMKGLKNREQVWKDSEVRNTRYK